LSELKARTYDDLVIEYMQDTLLLEKELVIPLVHKSSFNEMLKEDPDFIGHYPPEYWVQHILEEWCEILVGASQALNKAKIKSQKFSSKIDKVASMFANIEGAKSVNFKMLNGLFYFTVTFGEDHPKLGRLLAEVQVAIYQKYNIYVEANWELEDES